MYPSSTSSSSQSSTGPNGGNNNTGGLIRYGSAPSTLLATAVDSVTNPTPRDQFSSLGSSSRPHHQLHNMGSSGLQRAYGFQQDRGSTGGGGGGGGGTGMVSSSTSTSTATTTTPSPLVRHSSSPAGFLNHLAHAVTSNEDNGFSIARARGVSRLNSQLSFTQQETLSQISEETENADNGLNAENEKRKSAHSYTNTSYGVGPWEDANTIMFSMGPSKRAKNMRDDIISLNSMETQFSMPQTMLEMSSMDKLLNIPEDSVPCKIRAKRGCATHPRSIAERERRTRISGKLKKLQDLVPNMDKQTSYADMLDLAVKHIKGLQDHVQRLNKELDNCTCGCRKPQDSCRNQKS